MKLSELVKIKDAVPIGQLTEDQLSELQTALSCLGYPVGDIDGLFGPKTRNGWAEFMADIVAANPTLISPESVAALQEKLDEIAAGKDYDFSTKAGTIEAIKAECVKQGLGLPEQIAYVLATVEHETAGTFKPVREAFYISKDFDVAENWRRHNLRYYPYYGRGYVQLTWKKNYDKYSKLLGLDLVNHPDKAMDSNIALFALVHGFKTGTFTERKITDYVNDHKKDFYNARRCINGTDCAQDIAQLAEKYLRTLA